MENQTPNDGESNRTKPDAVDGPKSAATRATNILNILALALVIHFHLRHLIHDSQTRAPERPGENAILSLWPAQ